MSDELFPKNVSRLTELGIAFTRRPGSHHIETSCPSCAGSLHIDLEKPWHLCLGAVRCSASRRPFEEILEALADGKAGK